MILHHTYSMLRCNFLMRIPQQTLVIHLTKHSSEPSRNPICLESKWLHGIRLAGIEQRDVMSSVVDLVVRAAVVPQHAASAALRQKEGHYSGTTFIPIAIEPYGAFLSQTDEILRNCSWRAFPEHGASSPSTSVLGFVSVLRSHVVTVLNLRSHFSMRKLERFMC